MIMPGLETSAVFQVEFDSLIHRLYNWAENSEDPLSSYATGLLAAAMEVQDIAVGFREQNTRMITIMLKRLHELQAKAKQARVSRRRKRRELCFFLCFIFRLMPIHLAHRLVTLTRLAQEPEPRLASPMLPRPARPTQL